MSLAGCGVGAARNGVSDSLGDAPIVAPGADSTGGTGAVGGSGTTSSGTTGGAVACPLNQQPNDNSGGPSVCCSGAYALCDGFEDDAVGDNPNATRWTVEKLIQSFGLKSGVAAPAQNNDRQAVVEISDTVVARGKHSLHVTAPSMGFHHDMLVNRSIFPAPNNTFWGRAFVYFKGTLPAAVTLVDASGTLTNQTSETYVRISSELQMCLNYSPNDDTVRSNVVLPTDTWVCLEWQYKGDTHETHLFMDGKGIADMTKEDAPAYDAFRMGWEAYGLGAPAGLKDFDMYYDEIALDYARIGCDK